MNNTTTLEAGANCHYLHQRHYNLQHQLIGVRCTATATDGNWCKVHSYTADREVGAGSGPGYIPSGV